VKQAIEMASAQKVVGRPDAFYIVVAASTRVQFFLSTTPFYWGV